MERLEGGDTPSDQGAGETAADTTTEVVETEEVPSIDPPVSWKAEWKEQFKALPRDQQQWHVDRESERNSHFTKTQQESAEARKAAEAQVVAVQEERKTYASRLTNLIDVANVVDPVIAEGRRTDWAKAHADDPLGAPGKYFAYKQREQELSALQQHRDEVLQKVRYENYTKGDQALRESLPDIWPHDDKRKAFQSEFAKYLKDAGYSPDEANSIDDHRAVLLGRKAMLYDRLMAQQTQIAAKKVVPAQGKVARSQANESGDSNVRAEALSKRALKTGRTDDQVAAVLARL